MFEELGPQFEKKLLTVASNFMMSELETVSETVQIPSNLRVGDSEEIEAPQMTLHSYLTLVGIDQEISRWKAA